MAGNLYTVIGNDYGAFAPSETYNPGFRTGVQINEWLKTQPNVLVTLCGHDIPPSGTAPGTGQNVSHRVDTAADGHAIVGIYADYQFTLPPAQLPSQVVLLLELGEKQVNVRAFNTTTNQGTWRPVVSVRPALKRFVRPDGRERRAAIVEVKEGRGGVETWLVALVPFLAHQTEAGFAASGSPADRQGDRVPYRLLGLRGRSVTGGNIAEPLVNCRIFLKFLDKRPELWHSEFSLDERRPRRARRKAAASAPDCAKTKGKGSKAGIVR